MKRIVTHLLVAAGLAVGVCGVAEAHTDLSIGLSLGVPAPVYVRPAPVYAAPQPVYDHPGWDRGGWRDQGHDSHRWDHRDYDRGGRGGRGGWDARGDRGYGWHG
ncbi:PXPV repeat protein [Paraburkholderia saeva]|uniref:PXPV repeat protein n=1 Tax=Paraburkholderia saeva TaxID=2777537 RepID=UPI001E44A9CD|nr:PXPV repeat protein [Paraburkholderia saeva]